MRITERAPLLATIAITLSAHFTLLAQEPANITLPTTTLTSGRYAYQASTSITANSFTVNGGATAIFQAGSTITLNPGFSALIGSSFNAYVNPIYTPGSPMSGHASSNSPETISFNVAPPGVQSIAGGDIYLQAFDANGNLLHQCPINYTVSPSLIIMTDSGQEMALPGTASVTNATGECTVSGSASTMSGGSTSVTASLYMTFSTAAIGTYIVTVDTFDNSGNLSPLEYLGTLAVAQGSATLTLTTNPSPVSAPLNQQTTFSMTITGVNGFTNSDSVTLTQVGMWPGSTNIPSSVTLSSNNNGNPSKTISVTITPTVNEGTPVYYYELNGYNSKSGNVALWVQLTESQTITQGVTSNPAGLMVYIDGTECTTPCSQQWISGSQHSLVAPPQTGTNGTQYTFYNWTDGITQSTRTVSPSAPTTYTADFNSVMTGTDPKEYIYVNGRLIAIEVTQ